MTLLFCNVGWMEHYQGLGSGDAISGGGSYVKEEGRGHEICNFVDVNGVIYGYVQPPGQQINIDRIGANPDDMSISGITVVWTATRPTGGTAVVGWYKNATVFREYQKHKKIPSIHKKNGIDGFWIRVDTRDSKILAVDERTCEIPRQVKGGMGQSNIWHADSQESRKTVKRVNDLIKGKRAIAPDKPRASRQHDQERKVQIEKAAIRATCNHFESLGYSIHSVEKDNVGWDLEAASGKTNLKIEVKGLSGNNFTIELTPNEYKAFVAESDSYRLSVLVSALDKPTLYVCRYSKEQMAWVIEGHGNRRLDVQIKESAVIRCS